jgi:hypothetical protein
MANHPRDMPRVNDWDDFPEEPTRGYAIAFLAFSQSTEEQDYNGPLLDEYGDAVRFFGAFRSVRLCYDKVQGDQGYGWITIATWDGEWWRVVGHPEMPGFSDVEFRHLSEYDDT